MAHLGDFDASAVLYGKFTTYRPSTGAAFTLAGTPALSVYKDNSVTQSTTGVSMTADFDSVTGLNHFAVDTSADGTFYSAGSFFDIVITTGTVDSVSVVGAVVASFTIRKNSALKPTTAGRTLVVDASGLADANAVKLGPTGSGTAQTARDIGASVLLSSGSGAGQLDFTSGVVKANATQWLGGTIPAVNVTGVPLVDAKYLLGTIFSTPTVAGIPNVNAKTWNDLATVELPLVPTTAGRKLDVSAGGEAGVDWANVGSPTTSLALTGTTIATTQKVDIETIKTNPVVNAGTVTFPTTATLASTTNITAGTITTATNLTNAATAGDFTATMKTSIGTAVAASAVASVTARVTANTDQLAGQTVTAAAGVTFPTSIASPTNITAGTITTATNLTTNNDKTGYGLSAAAVQAIWDALTSALTTVGSIGKKLADWTIGTAQTGDSFARLGAPAGASVSADIAAVKVDTAAVKAKTDNLPSDPADASDVAGAFSTVNGTLATIAGYIDTEIGAIKAKTDLIPASPAAVGDIPTVAAIADAVWDEAIAGHAGAGSTGAALSAAGAAGDPWATALPGAYGAGTAGQIIGDNLDAAVSTRLATAGYTAPLSAAGTRSAVGLATANLDTQLDALPTNAELATALATADDAVLAILGAPAGASLSADVAAVKGDTATIKAKTDNLPSDPADASDVAAGVAAVKLYADRTVVRGTVSGTSPTTTTFTSSALSPGGVDADQFKGRIIVFDNATATTALRGQATDITASSAAANPLFTFSALTTAPQSGDTFSVL